MSFNLATAVFSLAGLVAMPVQDAAAQAPAAEPARSELPVSLSRIREALKKPDGPRFSTPLATPDFKVEVYEAQRFQDLVDLLDFSASPVLPAVLFGGFAGSRTQPLFNVSLNGIGESIGKGISNARRARAERLAREEVARALTQFCSTHECAAR